MEKRFVAIPDIWGSEWGVFLSETATKRFRKAQKRPKRLRSRRSGEARRPKWLRSDEEGWLAVSGTAAKLQEDAEAAETCDQELAHCAAEKGQNAAVWLIPGQRLFVAGIKATAAPMNPETTAHPKNTRPSSKGRSRSNPKIADAAAMLMSTQFCWWLISVARFRPSVVWAMP